MRHIRSGATSCHDNRWHRAERKASRVVLVADHSKFGRVTLGSFGPIEAAHVLVTDLATPRAFLTRIRQRGVEVMAAVKRGR